MSRNPRTVKEIIERVDHAIEEHGSYYEPDTVLLVAEVKRLRHMVDVALEGLFDIARMSAPPLDNEEKS